MLKEKLEQALQNWQDKLAEYEYELSIIAGIDQKFELRKRIREAETEINRINNTLKAFENKDSDSKPQEKSTNNFDINELTTKARFVQIFTGELQQVKQALNNVPSIIEEKLIREKLIKEKQNRNKKAIENNEKSEVLTLNEKIKILEKDFKLSNQIIQHFFAGKPVERQVFIELCSKLNLVWKDILDIDFLQVLVKVVPKVRSLLYDKIKEQCGFLRILDIKSPIELDNLYVDVNILEKPSSDFRLEISELPEVYDLETGEYDRLALTKISQARVPSSLVIKKHPKLIVLGKPGSGKSTFLQHIAIQCNEGEFQPERVPIFIPIKNFIDDAKNINDFSLLHYISREFNICGITEQSETENILKHGRALILFDGLDEATEEDSDKIVIEIRRFCDQYYKNQFIITCRIAAQKFVFPNFTYVEVADFNDRQMKAFAQNWFVAIDQEGGKTKAVEFIEKLNHLENQQIREISVTPVLLLLTCLVFENKKMFPINRSQLYEEGLEILLKRWDETKGIKRDEVYRNLTLLRKKKLLSHAAIYFFNQGKYFFEKDDIQIQIAEYISTLSDAETETDLQELLENSEAVLKSIEAQHGLLVERAQKIYSFSHLTFQEYFSALNFVNSSNQKDFQQLASHITQKRWREIFLLTDGILRNSDLLWWQIKQYIDAMIASDTNLQDFLVWVNEKTCSVGALHLVQNPYKANSVRSVYFAHHLSLDIDLAVTLDPVLAPTRELALNFQRKPVLDDARDINIARQVERDVALDIVLYHALYHENLNASLDIALARAIDRSVDVALDINQAHKLNKCLQTLQNKLPNKGRKTSNFNQWWESYGQDWTEQLRTVMIKYRNIGKDWQFCDEQKKLLKQYYYANQLLVDCLENAYKVSPNEKDKIKETLLLPMIESKKIYPNFSL